MLKAQGEKKRERIYVTEFFQVAHKSNSPELEFLIAPNCLKSLQGAHFLLW